MRWPPPAWWISISPSRCAAIPPRPEGHFLGVARWATVVWALVLVLVGLLARHWGSVLEAGLTIASILYGSLLGVFLLGLLTQFVYQNAAMIAMIAGLVLMLFVKQWTHIAFTWYVLIGTVGDVPHRLPGFACAYGAPHDRNPA